MGLTIPEIKEFHRKTNLDIGHSKLGYNTSAGDTWQDFSGCGELTCDIDIASLCLTTPQCPVVGSLDYISTATASFDGDLGEGNPANHENIREMRRTHFDVGFDDVDLNDTTSRTTYHRHPFTQAEGNTDKVSELRRTNWTLGFDNVNYASTAATSFGEGEGSPADRKSVV